MHYKVGLTLYFQRLYVKNLVDLEFCGPKLPIVDDSSDQAGRPMVKPWPNNLHGERYQYGYCGRPKYGQTAIRN